MPEELKKIEYFEIPGCDKKFFKCGPLRATLSTEACAQNYNTGNDTNTPLPCRHECQGCETGAHHAGKTVVKRNQYHGTRLCSRCHRTDMRIVCGRICVSCQNREYEVIKGRNAKGSPPIKHAGLSTRVVLALIDGHPQERRLDRATSVVELMLSTLRQIPGPVKFGMPRHRRAG